MFRTLLRPKPSLQCSVLRYYSQSSFDLSKILANSSNTSSDTSKTRDNRFSDKYSHAKAPRSFGNQAKARGNDQRQNQNHRDSRRKNNPRDRYTFEIRTGSDRAQQALKEIIVKVKGLSPNFQVQFVDPKSKKLQTSHLSKIVNNLDLSKEGLLLVPPKEEDKLPLVRINKSAEMLQNYSDQLAAQKEAELMQSGSERFMKKMLIRQQAEKKKSAAKLLTLSWSISLSDLMNQKKTEIMNRMKKDEKFQIAVGDRRSGLDNAEETEAPEEGYVSRLNRLSDEEYEFEMNKRKLLFEKLQELLEDCECKTEISGSLEGRIMVKVTAKPTINKVEDSGRSKEKEAKRLRKVEKAKQSTAKKASVTDEDLDALYSFKIED